MTRDGVVLIRETGLAPQRRHLLGIGVAGAVVLLAAGCSSAPKAGRRPPFVLAGTGRPEFAFLWKNLLSTYASFNLRTLGIVAGLRINVAEPTIRRLFTWTVAYNLGQSVVMSVFLIAITQDLGLASTEYGVLGSVVVVFAIIGAWWAGRVVTLKGTDKRLALADILRRDGRCLMALHICYTVMNDIPDAQPLWSAVDQAWRCVALRDRRENVETARVEPGDLLNAAAEFAQWQLAAEIRQSAHANGHSPNPEALILLRQAMLNEGYGRAGVAISFYEKAIATGFNSPAIFFTLGLIYTLVGRKQDARAAHLLAARHPFYRDAVALLE